MDACKSWRARMLAAKELWDDEDEDEEIMVSIVVSSSIEEEVPLPRVWGGSQKGKASNIDRNRFQMHQRMMLDYFCDNPGWKEIHHSGGYS
jgi:hypothetical protein